MRPSVTWPRSRSLPTTTTGACHRRTSHCVYTLVTLYLDNNNLDVYYWPQVWNGQVLEHSLTERRRGRAGVHLELRGEGLPNIRNTIPPGEERLWVGSLATRNTSQQVRQRLKKRLSGVFRFRCIYFFFLFLEKRQELVNILLTFLSMLPDRAAINLNQGKRKLLSQGWQIDGFHYIPLLQEGGGKVLELQLSTFLCWSRR